MGAGVLFEIQAFVAHATRPDWRSRSPACARAQKYSLGAEGGDRRSRSLSCRQGCQLAHLHRLSSRSRVAGLNTTTDRRPTDELSFVGAGSLRTTHRWRSAAAQGLRAFAVRRRFALVTTRFCSSPSARSHRKHRTSEHEGGAYIQVSFFDKCTTSTSHVRSAHVDGQSRRRD